jgi:FSR family fosmidomycin resistance protein-like MFS transporter
MSSGMTVGFAMGLGGIAAVVLGVVADAVDLRAALLFTAAAPALGALVALALPKDDRPRIPVSRAGERIDLLGVD